MQTNVINLTLPVVTTNHQVTNKLTSLTSLIFIVLQLFAVKYSKSLMLYQDDPAGGLVWRVVAAAILISAIIGSVFLLSSGETTGFVVVLLEGFLVFLILSIVIPRKYQVFQDHIRIILGGPFYIRIGFDNIQLVETTNKTDFTINFATAIKYTYVRIKKKKGLSIAITPKSNELFTENANRALLEWAGTKRDGMSL